MSRRAEWLLECARASAEQEGAAEVARRIDDILRRHFRPRPRLQKVRDEYLGSKETSGVIECALSRE